MDEACPKSFREEARAALRDFAQSVTTSARLAELAPSSWSQWREVAQPKHLDDLSNVRQGLLLFIADFSNWDASHDETFLRCARRLTAAAQNSSDPVTVLDPFAGGGAIPVEALRIGTQVIASDLNPVAVLLNRVALEDIPKFGTELLASFDAAAAATATRLKERTAGLFPVVNGQRPIAYIYARTIFSEDPSGGDAPVEIPLIRSMWLAKRKKGGVALQWQRDARGRILTEAVRRGGRTVKRPLLSIVEVASQTQLEAGTTIGGAATCPITGYTTPVESVRRQLKAERGGSDTARLLAVVCDSNGKKVYRAPVAADSDALREAMNQREATRRDSSNEINHLRGFINIVLYGIEHWSDAFNARQFLVLSEVMRSVDALHDCNNEESGLAVATQRCLALAADRLADYNSALCTWRADGEFIGHTFGQGQALPMRLDFVEVNPLSESTGDWNSATQWVRRVIEELAAGLVASRADVLRGSATKLPLPDDSIDLVFTDPPYYAAVPYADLSDFFYVWLRRGLGRSMPDLFGEELTPKAEELVSLSHRAAMYREKDGAWFETHMRDACSEARRVARPGALAVWVFANKETSAWEAMLGALIDAGWIITASWPLDTEMEARLRARNSAALASSIHIACRPRENPDGSLDTTSVGEWRQVLAALPQRIHEWMPRLAAEGVVGADAIFACLGPALEVFSRYAKVEKADGSNVHLAEYLEQVWSAVAHEALSMVFASADTAGLEPDGRLTAIWLWTVNVGTVTTVNTSETDTESEDEPVISTTSSGHALEFDAARKLAQGLGAHLENLDHLVEVRGDTARLLPVSDRARHLFAKVDVDTKTKPRKKKNEQSSLFEEIVLESESESPAGAPKPATTTLDRVHQSMLLFGAGRGEALKRFLIEDGVGNQPQFWKLAQSLSALYPSGTDEKRWVDGVLARKKSFGFA